MKKNVKSLILTAFAVAAVSVLVTCNVFTSGEYKERNVNGYKLIQLRSPQQEQNLPNAKQRYGIAYDKDGKYDPTKFVFDPDGDTIFMNRLAFGVSSRRITKTAVPAVVYDYPTFTERGGTPNAAFAPWGNIIQDTDDVGDPGFLFDEKKWTQDGPSGGAKRQIVLTSINETCNAGKIAGSEDGISYYFWPVAADVNFRISADFFVDSFGFTAGRAELNGQEAFGFMARDYVPQHENVGNKSYDLTTEGLKGRGKRESPAYTNPGRAAYTYNGDGSSPIPGGHVPWDGVYWNGQDTALNDGVASSSSMIMVGGVKRGTRVYWRTDVADPDGLLAPVTDPNTIANADFAKFNYWPREFSDYSMYGTGITGTQSRPDFPTAGLTYSLYMERTNSGFIVKIIPPKGVKKGITKDRKEADGNELIYTDRELSFPDMLANARTLAYVNGDLDRSELPTRLPVNLEHYYVGFFVARDAKVTISNIKYEESPSQLCAPRVDPIPGNLTPTFSIQSPNSSSSADYILYARANVEGLLSLSFNNGEAKVYKSEWIVEKSNASAEPFALFKVEGIKLKNGDNTFDAVFTPDKKQALSGYLPDDNGVLNNNNNLLMANASPISRSFIVNRRSMEFKEKYGKNQYEVMYVAPNGRSTGDGTRENPLDVVTAIAVSSPNQMIVLMDGIYTPLDNPELVEGRQRTPIRLRVPRYNSGLPNKDQGAPSAPFAKPEKPGDVVVNPGEEETNPYYPYNDPYYKYYKVLRAENRDKAIFDFRKDLAERGYLPRNFEHNGDYWIFDGFHVRNCYDTYVGLKIGGSNNLARWIKTYFNGDTGFIIQGSASDPKSIWPANNRIEYCESFGNADFARTNADGFAAKLTVWEGNVFYRTISHHNIDDGYDLFAKKETGPIGALYIQQCFAYFNGRYLNDEMGYSYSDEPIVALRPKRNNSAGVGGNGFKMGGEGIPVLHLSIDCLSFGNDGDGFTSNSDPAIRLTHVSSFDNYNRIDTNPGGNIVIYSASSPSYEGLDAIITQVFSWQSGNVMIGREDVGGPSIVYKDLVTIDKNLRGPLDPGYLANELHPSSVQGKRNDRVEPKGPASGYVWRNYDDNGKYIGYSEDSAGKPNGRPGSVQGIGIGAAVYDGNNLKDYRGLPGRSVSTQYVIGRGKQNNTPINLYEDNHYIKEWKDAFSKDPYVMLRDREMFTSDGLAPWDTTSDKNTLDKPYVRMGKEARQDSTGHNGTASGKPGKIEGEFFYVYGGGGNGSIGYEPGYAEKDTDPYYWGLPELKGFMELNSIPGVMPGARGLWK